MRRKLVKTALFAVLAGAALAAAAQEGEPHPFYPTWKLLGAAEKQQFIAGYLRCWKDTASILEIALEYSRTDPAKARDALQSLRALYGGRDIRPDALAAGIDKFFEDPGNQGATLTRAITAAMARAK